jgi:hypothetical protein
VGYDLRFLDPAAAQARKADAFDAGAREAFAFAAPLEHRPRSAPGISSSTIKPKNRYGGVISTSLLIMINSRYFSKR